MYKPPTKLYHIVSELLIRDLLLRVLVFRQSSEKQHHPLLLAL